MEVGNGGNRLDRRKTMTMTWADLGDFEDDDDDRFFETHDRLSSAVSLDMAASSSDEDEDFDDCRISFSSAVSSFTTVSNASRKFRSSEISPDYEIWMAAPGSISERRRRLLHGMGLASGKDLIRAVSIRPVASNKAIAVNLDDKEKEKDTDAEAKVDNDHREEKTLQAPLVPILLTRSRSESEIEKFSIEKRRKEEILGKVSKQRLTRTSSMIAAARARICQYQTPVNGRNGPNPKHGGSAALTSVDSNSGFAVFFLIKNLDTGKEFVVNEYDQDGMWNRVSDLQTGKQLTLDEFEKCVGHSPVVKELMRRENVNRVNYDPFADIWKLNSYLSKSVRMSKKRGAALLKNIKDVAHSMSLKVMAKDISEGSTNSPRKGTGHKHGTADEWVKVTPTGKTYKELSALHLCQEIQAHEGAIWTIKFSGDARYLASAGEDRVIHVWEVQECEIMSMSEGTLTSIHPSLCESMERSSAMSENGLALQEKKTKGKVSPCQGFNQIPEYVHVPETVFSFSEKPVCSFKGHLDDILDLSWSKSQLLLSSSMDKTVRLWDLETRSCLKLFAHNDYVTCIQFNPLDENYFISGSLDAKIRIWNIPERHVVEWSDLNEMVTAASYTPDGQGAVIGSHKGVCRVYGVEDCKLNQTNQIDVQQSKKSQAKKKITGLQFSPVRPSELLVTSADSRIKILDGSEVIHKFKGFRNTNSQISASYSQDGKYIVCASEDSQVYVWRTDRSQRTTTTTVSTGKRTTVTTQAHEHFQCKDVSVAVPWHGHVRGEPPPLQIHSRRHSKRVSAVASPTREDTSASISSKKKLGLPPLPKRNAARTVQQHGEEEPGSTESSSSSRSSLGSNSSDQSSSWWWLDAGGGHGTTVEATAWGMVIVTATLNGQIRAFQNFGLPRRIGRQTSLFS